MINTVANLDLVEQSLRMFHISRGLVEISIDLIKEFDGGHGSSFH
jgi:hypothetical protein